MLKLNLMPTIKDRSRKRRGRGYGSGKGGHTSGRGQKGQKTRGKMQLWFEGGQLPLIRRLPFQRGKLRFNSLSPSSVVVNVEDLNRLSSKTEVTAKELEKKGLIRRDELHLPIKILGRGTLTVSLTVKLPTSLQAKKKIRAAGGIVLGLGSPPEERNKIS